MTDLGTCWGTPNGQDLSSPSYMASGNQCVAEAVLRRWSTGRGQLIDDPNYGYNLIDLISAKLTPRDVAYAQQQAGAEAMKDSRVKRADVALAFLAGVITVTAVITTAAGPFTLVASVSAVGVKLLQVSP